MNRKGLSVKIPRSSRKLNEAIATEIMGWETKLVRGPIERPTEIGDPKEDKSFGLLRYWKVPGQVWSWDGITSPSFMESPYATLELIDQMNKKHHLTCRAVFVGLGQISVAFYFSVGSQLLFKERIDESNLKGLATSGSFGRSVCEAALQAVRVVEEESLRNGAMPPVHALECLGSFEIPENDGWGKRSCGSKGQGTEYASRVSQRFH